MSDEGVPVREAASFREAVAAIVRAVPEGRTVTYGAVATLAGRPRAARLVGGALRAIADADPDFPWHRVVNAQGGISTHRLGFGELQEALLRREGVAVEGGRVDLGRYGAGLDELRGVQAMSKRSPDAR